jgi:hypothetical protein
MKRQACLSLILSLFVLIGLAQAQPKRDNCAACHIQIDKDQTAIVDGYKTDVHYQEGFTCAACHGGDESKSDEDAMDPDKGFIGAPAHGDIPHVCGRCHSDANFMRHYDPTLAIDQEEKYYTSQHGKLLKKGDQKVATCISCHGVHGILPVKNGNSPVYKVNIPSTCNKCHGDAKYMAPYKIPTNQYQLYSESVHGVALLQKQEKGAPACNDCHGNHGAAPPGVNDIAAVCMLCHASNGDLFNKSPHKEAFEEAGLSQCAVCHNHHKIMHPTDDWLGVGKDAKCVECHSQGDPGYKVAAQMKQVLDSLLNGQDQARQQLSHAKDLGMDVADGETAVESVRENVIAARTAIHAFSVSHLEDVTSKGFEAEEMADSLAVAAVHEYYFRRTGFGVATLIITGLALLLWLRIRRTERRQKNKV